MRAPTPTLVLETGRALAAAGIVAGERAEPKALLRNMALFLVAPFIGLVYALLLPFVGLAMLAVHGARAFYRTGKAHALVRTGRKWLLCALMPFAGLAYLVVLPVAGLAALAWVAARAARARAPAA